MNGRVPMIVLLFLRCFLFLFGGVALALLFRSSLTETDKWWSILCSVCNGVTLLVLYRLNRKDGMSFLRRIRYQKGSNHLPHVLTGIIVVLTVGMSGMLLAGFLVYHEYPYLPEDLLESIPIGFAVLNIAVLPLSTTLAEDGLYLGFGVNSMKNRWIGWLLPAFAYAFQHCFIPLRFDFAYMIYRFLSFFPLTLLICRWYQRNHNPVPIMAGHFVINLATAVQILTFSLP